MKHIWTILKRELTSYFTQPTALFDLGSRSGHAFMV